MAFKNLEKLKVCPEDTVRLVLPISLDDEHNPVLIGVCASTHLNKAMEVLQAKQAAEPIPKGISKEIRDQIERQRQVHAIASTVLRGWEHVYGTDDNDKLVQKDFSVEEAEKFLAALYDNAPDVFVRAALFFAEVANFRQANVKIGADVPKS